MTGPETGVQDPLRIRDAASIKMRLEEEIVSLITETQGMSLWSFFFQDSKFFFLSNNCFADLPFFFPFIIPRPINIQWTRRVQYLNGRADRDPNSTSIPPLCRRKPTRCHLPPPFRHNHPPLRTHRLLVFNLTATTGSHRRGKGMGLASVHKMDQRLPCQDPRLQGDHCRMYA